MQTYFNGLSEEILKNFPDNYFDSIVTDPPYGLEFMGHKWDYSVPSVAFWREAFRVLKPGGYVLSFGGTRTYHRMVINIEDAGFEIRDQLQWIYGSGFPKSKNINEVREGWGTALKPANEPICLARKPIGEKTVAANVIKWGTGAINIDGCRISLNGESNPVGSAKRVFAKNGYNTGEKYGDNTTTPDTGRFPANVLMDPESGEMLDRQTGILKSGVMKKGTKRTAPFETRGGFHGKFPEQATEQDTYGDSGGPSRFFYCGKTSRKERNAGLEDFQTKDMNWSSGTKNPGSFQSEGTDRSAKNYHPTVKPVSVMRWLVRLVTPPGGIVLDPFAGSGTTGMACKDEGLHSVLIEREKEFCLIGKARIDNWNEDAQLELDLLKTSLG